MQIDLTNVSDQELIEALESRGYVVSLPLATSMLDRVPDGSDPKDRIPIPKP